jgi:hypothetical protein
VPDSRDDAIVACTGERRPRYAEVPGRVTCHVRAYAFGRHPIPEMLDKKGVLEGVVPESWEVSDLRLVGEAASSPTAMLVLDLGYAASIWFELPGDVEEVGLNILSEAPTPTSFVDSLVSLTHKTPVSILATPSVPLFSACPSR